jgi:hypothetical protein
VVYLSASTPAVSRSMSVHVLVEKPYQQIAMTALFDNVLLKRP